MTRPGVSPPQRGPRQGASTPPGWMWGWPCAKAPTGQGHSATKARTALRADGARSDRLRITAIALPGLRGPRHLTAPATVRAFPDGSQYPASISAVPGQYLASTAPAPVVVLVDCGPASATAQHPASIRAGPAQHPHGSGPAPDQHQHRTGPGPNQHQARPWPAPLPRLPGCWAGPAAGTAN